MGYQFSVQELKELNEYMEKDILENGRNWCIHCGNRYKEDTDIESVCPDCLKTRYVEYGAVPCGCAFCENLGIDWDSDDMGYNYSFWFTCNKTPYENLKTFPFKNTSKLCLQKGYFKPRVAKFYA